jgi:hypothetical protein
MRLFTKNVISILLVILKACSIEYQAKNVINKSNSGLIQDYFHIKADFLGFSRVKRSQTICRGWLLASFVRPF